jgi:hypothetical protein
MTEQSEFLNNIEKKKYPNPPGKRKEWDLITVDKKILFELRRIGDSLEKIIEFAIQREANLK